MLVLPNHVQVVKESFAVARTNTEYVVTIALKIADPSPRFAILLPVDVHDVHMEITPLIGVGTCRLFASSPVYLGAVIPDLLDDSTLRWAASLKCPMGVVIGSTTRPDETVSFSVTVHCRVVRVPLGAPPNRARPPVLTEVSITGRHRGLVGATETSRDVLFVDPSSRSATFNKKNRPHHDLVETFERSTSTPMLPPGAGTNKEDIGFKCLIQ
jgi:hypothetical protein